MEKEKTLLKDLTVNSVDLCKRGANPDAYFVLKKAEVGREVRI